MGEVCRSDLWGNRQVDADGPNRYTEKQRDSRFVWSALTSFNLTWSGLTCCLQLCVCVWSSQSPWVIQQPTWTDGTQKPLLPPSPVSQPTNSPPPSSLSAVHSAGPVSFCRRPLSRPELPKQPLAVHRFLWAETSCSAHLGFRLGCYKSFVNKKKKRLFTSGSLQEASGEQGCSDWCRIPAIRGPGLSQSETRIYPASTIRFRGLKIIREHIILISEKGSFHFGKMLNENIKLSSNTVMLY